MYGSALQALISSLTPNDSSQAKRLSEEQADALSERLSHILGNVRDGPEVKRNEKGEVLNEEGLPIIDITEPLGDESHAFQSPEAFLSEHDPPPSSTMSERDREQLRIRRDRILDILEEEERRESERDLERERKRQLEEVAQMDAGSKAAAREMQKKMGKALLKNLAAQREKEEEERKKVQEATSAEPPSQNGSATCKKKKSVSFANVPDVDEEKPKPPVAWGDVSVAKLKSGVPKARLKSRSMDSQPMKFEVVERIPGVEQKPVQERDSDDESNGETQDYGSDGDTEKRIMHSFDDEYGSDEHMKHSDDSDEDDFDFSQASVQREVALEYIRLRERVGAEARQVMTSHTYEPENEWDHPFQKVPLEASLASEPSKNGVSRFKAERQTSLIGSGDASVSLGASLLPEGRSTLQKTVRTGKLVNGQLTGDEGSDSELEEGERENVKRMIEALKQGVTIDDPPMSAVATGNRTTRIEERNTLTALPTLQASETRLPCSSSTKRPSRFKSERESQGLSSDCKTTAPSSISSPLSNTVLDHPVSAKSWVTDSVSARPTVDNRPALPPSAAFKKPPTAVSVPSVSPTGRRPFTRPQVVPDPAVLNNMIVDSPSFPPPNSSTRTQSSARPPPLVSEVRESTRRATGHSDEVTQKSGKVSRFKAERTQGLM
ncbi:hypothetical protein A7U60_g9004 [Sanghuangporus baumii]|uniref:DUF3835 domain-containing protein n=1 Tax=Sanghuangporus baumii TaxID=108892 RepID=A0A9Q5HQZ1_SANBA|nr:hypothetical protein A7U60_g9004 [Sanghuangporus baumii]